MAGNVHFLHVLLFMPNSYALWLHIMLFTNSYTLAGSPLVHYLGVVWLFGCRVVVLKKQTKNFKANDERDLLLLLLLPS